MIAANLADLADLEIQPLAPSLPQREFILAQLEQHTLIVPSELVAEILVIDKSQILPLPFYRSAMLGCIHHEGEIVPLVAGDRLLGLDAGPLRSTLSAIRFSSTVMQLAGVGLVAHRILGSKTLEQLPPEIVAAYPASNDSTGAGTMRLFRPEDVDPIIWHPLDRQALSRVSSL